MSRLPELDENGQPKDVTPYILNEVNKPITEGFILELLARYGVEGVTRVEDLPLFQRAMAHRSYLVRDPDYKPLKQKKKKKHIVNYLDIEPVKDPSKVVPLQEYPYERLEFLGDSVFHLVLAEYLFRRYPTADEGFMSRLRTKIENKQAFAELCQKVGIDEYVLISKRMEMNRSRTENVSILEDCFEAFIGALYLEYGFQVCRSFSFGVIEREVDITELLRVDTNYKDTLLQYYHAKEWREPEYGTIKEMGPDHQKMYTMYVTDGVGKRIAVGTGNSKKAGEQEAAKHALLHYRVLTREELDLDDYHEELESESSDSESDDEEDFASLYESQIESLAAV